MSLEARGTENVVSLNEMFAHTRTADENTLIRRISNRVSVQMIVSAKHLDKRRLK